MYYLHVTCVTVSRAPKRNNLKKERLRWLMVSEGCSPLYLARHGRVAPSHDGGRLQVCLVYISVDQEVTKRGWSRGSYHLQSPIPSELFPPSRPYLLKVLHPLKHHQRAWRDGSSSKGASYQPWQFQSLGPTWWKKKTDSCKLSFDLPLWAMDTRTCPRMRSRTRTYTHFNNKCKNKIR